MEGGTKRAYSYSIRSTEGISVLECGIPHQYVCVRMHDRHLVVLFWRTVETVVRVNCGNSCEGGFHFSVLAQALCFLVYEDITRQAYREEQSQEHLLPLAHV